MLCSSYAIPDACDESLARCLRWHMRFPVDFLGKKYSEPRDEVDFVLYAAASGGDGLTPPGADGSSRGIGSSIAHVELEGNWSAISFFRRDLRAVEGNQATPARLVSRSSFREKMNRFATKLWSSVAFGGINVWFVKGTSIGGHADFRLVRMA